MDVLKDPVCGMTVTPKSPHRLEYAGETYLFCCAGCLTKFQQDPQKYLLPGPAQAGLHTIQIGGVRLQPDLHAAAEYTCPMHPEIVRDRPGPCPLCGMALEPKTITGAADEDNPELRDMTRRFWIATALSAPLFVLAMGRLASPLVELLLATPVCLWAAWPFYVRAVQSVVNDYVGGGINARLLPPLRHSKRGGRRHHDADPPWAGPRASREEPDEFRHTTTSGPGTDERPPHSRGRTGRRCAARRGSRWR